MSILMTKPDRRSARAAKGMLVSVMASASGRRRCLSDDVPEDGTTQDFFLRTDIPAPKEFAVVNSTARGYTATHSLALPVKAAG